MPQIPTLYGVQGPDPGCQFEWLGLYAPSHLFGPCTVFMHQFKNFKYISKNINQNYTEVVTRSG